MRNKEISEKIQKLSFGVLNTFVDSSLFFFAFWAQSYAVSCGRKDFFKAIENSLEFVKEIKGESLKRGIYHASRKGFMIKNKNEWAITKLGKERLKEVLPRYYKERTWDGKIYLVTYDVPEIRKKTRDLLREYLKRIGCGMLQASVWITPYNPKKVLADFIADYKLLGLVIVSDIGKDGNVGQVPIEELVEKVYKLENLNKRYREFLLEVNERKLVTGEVALTYFSILREDPQLPFALLSRDWLGDKAYQVFRKVYQDF